MVVCLQKWVELRRGCVKLLTLCFVSSFLVAHGSQADARSRWTQHDPQEEVIHRGGYVKRGQMGMAARLSEKGGGAAMEKAACLEQVVLYR
jgi:hypothetical protein